MPEGSDSELLELAERVAGWARDGEGLEVYVSRGTELDIRVYAGQVEHLSSAASAGVGIRVITGNRQGFAYAGALDESLISDTLAEARDNASFATPDEYVGLAEPDGIPPADLDLWDESVAALPTAAKVDLALRLEERVRTGDPRIRQVDSADYGDLMTESAVASSTGVRAATRRTVSSLSVSAIAGTGTDSHTGVGFSAARGPGDLDSEAAAVDAIERATRLLGATKTRSGHFTVVFDPRVTSTLLSVLSSAFSGEAVNKGRSLFADRLGEVVASPSITLVDDPTDPRAFGAGAFDAEGLACRRNLLIDAGTLRSFVFDTGSARRAGTTSTASAVRGGYGSTPTAGCRALALAPGSLDALGVLAAVSDGLYVQSVTGVHSGVNPVSGDFSVGVEGLLICDGALGAPVREVTIASTLQKMLQSVLHVGRDVEWLPGLAAGQTLAIDGMALSGS
jgi:PmbA protein